MQRSNQSSVSSQGTNISQRDFPETTRSQSHTLLRKKKKKRPLIYIFLYAVAAATKMEEILNILAPVSLDESLAHYEVHSHQPYASSSFDNSDEIRIAIQHQDLYILPSKSSLHIHGKLVKSDGTNVTATALISNAAGFLFDEIPYELNGIETDRFKNAGLTSIIKGYVSLTPIQLHYVENAGWPDADLTAKITNDDGYFDVTIPLSMILGFAKYYRKIITH